MISRQCSVISVQSPEEKPDHQPLTTDDSNNNSRFPRYILCFFAFFIVVDLYFVYLAVSTHTGTVTENSYDKGREYNKTIAAVEAQDKLGFSGDIVLKNKMLAFILKDKNKNIFTKAKVEAFFSRPIVDGYDFSIQLFPAKTGNYYGDVKFPKKGQWDVVVVAKWNNHQYQKSKRLLVE